MSIENCLWWWIWVWVILAVAFGGWAASDCKARQVSMEGSRDWRESDPVYCFIGFFFLISVLGAIGLILAYLRYNALRTHSQIQERKATEASKPVSISPEDLLKWKELLDAGIISESQFNVKKREALGMVGQWDL